MSDLTLIIPAKYEKESLPKVLDELENFNFKKDVILEASDKLTIEAINTYDCEIIYQDSQGYGDALKKGIDGNWNLLDSFIKLVGYVNCKEDFTDQPKIINGASDIIVNIFGGYYVNLDAFKESIISLFPEKIKYIGLKNFLQKILNGELNMIYGNYLVLFIISFLIIFFLAMINIYLNKRSKIIQ